MQTLKPGFSMDGSIDFFWWQRQAQQRLLRAHQIKDRTIAEVEIACESCTIKFTDGFVIKFVPSQDGLYLGTANDLSMEEYAEFGLIPKDIYETYVEVSEKQNMSADIRRRQFELKRLELEYERKYANQDKQKPKERPSEVSASEDGGTANDPEQ